MLLTRIKLNSSQSSPKNKYVIAGLLISLFFSLASVAQENGLKKVIPVEPAQRVEMTQSQMAAIVAEMAGEYQGTPNNLQFSYNGAPMSLISDEDNNRMRLLTPIVSVDSINDELLQASMVSNFHLALDARYAIGNGVLYATYIHPLKELTKGQLESAMRQVSSLRSTFGSTFTSGELLYGGRNPQEQDI